MKEGKKGGEERGFFFFFLREKKWNVCLWKGLSGHFHIGRDRYPVGVIVCGGGGERDFLKSASSRVYLPPRF